MVNEVWHPGVPHCPLMPWPQMMVSMIMCKRLVTTTNTLCQDESFLRISDSCWDFYLPHEMYERNCKFSFKILLLFFFTCTGYRTPNVFLTRSVCLCSSVWTVLRVVLHWDRQFEVILLCRETGQSGVQGLLLCLFRNDGINCRLDLSKEICRLVPRLLLDTWKHTRTRSDLVFMIRHALLSLY